MISTLKIRDMLDADLLQEMTEQGYVKITEHPTAGLKILNYTAAAAYGEIWNNVTTQCRGLVVDGEWNVLARPFKKFFNYGEYMPNGAIRDEPFRAPLPLGEIYCTDKMDGSLGILYPINNGHAIATRGSFTSDQAIRGTEIWKTKYERRFIPNPAWTYLFEIIYPGNRIVVDYEGDEVLVWIGTIDIQTGRSILFSEAFEYGDTLGLLITEYFPYKTLEEALVALPRPNAEGIVIHFIDADLRIKLKQEDYVRLHRLVTGLSERRIWEALSEGLSTDEWLENVPDEFYSFVTTTIAKLQERYRVIAENIDGEYEHLCESLGIRMYGYERDHPLAPASRRDFAMAVTELGKTWAFSKSLYMKLDKQEAKLEKFIWARIRPEVHVPFFSQSEDSN